MEMALDVGGDAALYEPWWRHRLASGPRRRRRFVADDAGKQRAIQVKCYDIDGVPDFEAGWKPDGLTRERVLESGSGIDDELEAFLPTGTGDVAPSACGRDRSLPPRQVRPCSLNRAASRPNQYPIAKPEGRKWLFAATPQCCRCAQGQYPQLVFNFQSEAAFRVLLQRALKCHGIAQG
jgi:hypothetical protein